MLQNCRRISCRRRSANVIHRSLLRDEGLRQCAVRKRMDAEAVRMWWLTASLVVQIRVQLLGNDILTIYNTEWPVLLNFIPVITSNVIIFQLNYE